MMRIMFKGALEKHITGGCKPCGRKGRTDSKFVTSKIYILPSGITKKFRMNVPEEVCDMDGEFLLSYNAPDINGHMRNVFEVVS